MLQQYKACLQCGGLTQDTELQVLLPAMISMLIWAARHNLLLLAEQVASLFACEIHKSCRLVSVSTAQDPEGYGVVHALVLSGQAKACQDLVAALPHTAALSLLSMRSPKGTASEVNHDEMPRNLHVCDTITM